METNFYITIYDDSNANKNKVDQSLDKYHSLIFILSSQSYGIIETSENRFFYLNIFLL